MNELNNYGKNGQLLPFKSKTEFLRDHAFYALGSEISNMRLFSMTSNVSPMYKTPEFPSMSQAYQINGFRCTVDGFVDGTNDAERMAKYRHLVNNSSLVISRHDEKLLEIPLKEMLKFAIEPNPNKTLGVPEYRIIDKFQDIYMLTEPMKIAAGQALEFELKIAKGVKVAAADTTKKGEGFYPNSNVPGGGDLAFGIFIEMEAVKIQEAQ